MTVKNNQRRLYQQIVSQFRGNQHFPVVISDFEASHGRQVRWTLRARNATGAIRERWAGASWIIELVSTGRRDGKPFHHVHLFITTLRTSPKALLRLVRQRWAIENQWHWPRDTQLGEDTHRYTHRNGVQVLALLRTMALNLLRWNGFRSIRAGLMAVAHDISRMLSWVGISAAEKGMKRLSVSPDAGADPPELHHSIGRCFDLHRNQDLGKIELLHQIQEEIHLVIVRQPLTR